MKIEKIFLELGIPADAVYKKIHGGKDSSVFQIAVRNGPVYALRILPTDRHEQFVREKNMIDLADRNGVNVPNVHAVIQSDDYSVMLMEWSSGRLLLIELQHHPETAEPLGVQFGKVQAAINKISVSDAECKIEESWITPVNPEENALFNQILQTKNQNLLHLDFHPLNVLMDGEEMTAVIDWANASPGDYRCDIARTLSILEVEGYKLFKMNPETMANFVNGWKRGYEESFGAVEYSPMFIS